jgi:hypothetical protein
MGADKRENEKASNRSRASATALKGHQLALFGEDGTRNSDGGGADWGSVNPDVICRVLSAITSRGGAIRFGYSRDGGAYAIGLYYGGVAKTVYCSPHDSVDSLLSTWAEKYLELPATGGAAPAE